jgi:hypothetical protein
MENEKRLPALGRGTKGQCTAMLYMLQRGEHLFSLLSWTLVIEPIKKRRHEGA